MKNKIRGMAYCLAMSLAGTIILFLPASGLADENGDWAFSFTPYIFAVGLEGDVATLPPVAPAEVDVPFSDILDNLDLAFMGVGEARKGKFGIWGDLFYSDLSVDADTPGPFYSGADYDQTLLFITVGGSYRLVETEKANLDAIVGLRYTHLDNEFDLDAGIFPSTDIDHKEDWLDPLVGIKLQAKICDKLYVSGWAMAAVAGESDSAFDLFGGIGYEFSASRSLIVGYRYLSVDYEDGAFLFDVELAGPVIGFTFRF